MIIEAEITQCDERPPRCANCIKWGKTCDYELLGFQPSRASTPPKGGPQTRKNKKVTKRIFIPRSPPEMNLIQLELMHHYSIYTSSTLLDATDPGLNWDAVVPHQALSHEFLMHAVLAVSALHIVHLRGLTESTEGYLVQARSHHNEAFKLFRSDITEITSKNCTAAVTFSVLVLIFSCGTSQLVDPLQPHNPIDNMITLLKSFRGYWKLFSSLQHWISMGPLGGLPPLRSIGRLPFRFQTDSAMEALSALEILNAASPDSDEDKQTYQDTIINIKQSLQNGCALPRVLWSVTVSDEYMMLLEQNRPMALIILAHGAVHHAPYRWFVHNLGPETVKFIERLLDPEWKPFLAWPLRELGLIGEIM